MSYIDRHAALFEGINIHPCGPCICFCDRSGKSSQDTLQPPITGMHRFCLKHDNPYRAIQIIGRCLADVWFDLTMEQMEAVVQRVARIEGEMLNVTFNSIGSLVKDNQSGAIRVGHMAKNRCYSALEKDNSGPWSSSRDFLKTLALSEISFMRDQSDSWLTRRKGFSPDEDANDTLRYMSTWYTLLCRAIDSLNFEAFDPPSCPVILRHDDLNLSNILVAYDDPARVVGIVDWEGARCIPLWTHMIGDNFLEPNDLKRHSPEALTHLRSIRHAIHVEMQPALSLMDQPLAQALEWICEILTWPSTLRPISDLDSCIQFASEACSADEIAAFGEIVEFVSQSRCVLSTGDLILILIAGYSDACEEDSIVPPFSAA